MVINIKRTLCENFVFVSAAHLALHVQTVHVYVEVWKRCGLNSQWVGDF